jgi:hypothetical protein
MGVGFFLSEIYKFYDKILTEFKFITLLPYKIFL